MSSLIEFLALATVLVALPGPAVILTLKHTVTRGRAHALATAAGVFTADLLWVVALCAGLTALLVGHPVAFDVVRYAGAAFLVYVGMRLMLTKRNTGVLPPELHTASMDSAVLSSGGASLRAGKWSAYRDGIICDLSNPKTMIVFTSVIPQFMHVGSAPSDAITNGLLFAVVGFLSLSAYIVLFDATSRVLRSHMATAVAVRIAGLVLLILGVDLMIARPTIPSS